MREEQTHRSYIHLMRGSVVQPWSHTVEPSDHQYSEPFSSERNETLGQNKIHHLESSLHSSGHDSLQDLITHIYSNWIEERKEMEGKKGCSFWADKSFTLIPQQSSVSLVSKDLQPEYDLTTADRKILNSKIVNLTDPEKKKVLLFNSIWLMMLTSDCDWGENKAE